MGNDACKINRWQLLKAKLSNVQSKELESFLTKTKNCVLLDVRTKDEYGSGHLPKALHMDFLGDDFWDQFEGLDHDKTYLVYCRSGRRSARVSLWMQNAGFKNVYNLSDGLSGASDRIKLATFS